MIDNILEYVVSDAFFQLWLMSSDDEHKTVRTKDMYPERLVQQFENTEDLPDCIIVHEPATHTNSKGEFHFGDSKEPTAKFKEMILIWGDRTEAQPVDDDMGNDLYSLNRKNGPSRVVLSGVQKWHSDGYIHRRRGDAIICKQATFTWASKGRYKRADGPYHISLRGFQAEGNKGEVTNIRLGSLVPSWATVNGRKLPQIEVRNVIRENHLQVNLLAFGSVFLGAEDEVVFLTEIAE